MARSPAVTSFLWRRLDAPGHDTCRLVKLSEGPGARWCLEGAAVFRHEDGSHAQLGYRVYADEEFRSVHGAIRGWVGNDAVDHDIARHGDGTWLLNGAQALGLAHCVDLDLGFTPATNLLQLRRLSLAVGNAADAPVAWMDLNSRALEALDQRYERRSETTYWYTSPRFDYAALLTVTPEGFVAAYPQLWVGESSAGG